MNGLANLSKLSLPNLVSDKYGWNLFEGHIWRCIDEFRAKTIIIESLSNTVDPILQQNLQTVSFQNKLFKECQKVFLDTSFLQKLDSNTNIWICNNGVLDFKDMTFRDGRMDDYAMLSCGLDYVENVDTAPLQDFLSKIFPNEIEREKVLDMLASAMTMDNGDDPAKLGHSRAIFYTALPYSGSTTCIHLFETLFGGYYIKMPREIISKPVDIRPFDDIYHTQARFKGKRIVFCQEPSPSREEMDPKVLRALVDRISLDLYHKIPFVFKSSREYGPGGVNFETYFAGLGCQRKPQLDAARHTFQADADIYRQIPKLATALLTLLFKRLRGKQ